MYLRFIFKVTIITLVGIIFLTSMVLAHKPIFADQKERIEIPDHRISYAVYGKLTGEDSYDLIFFRGSKGDPVFIQMTVPDLKEEKNFKPDFVLIGPGLPAVTSLEGWPVVPKDGEGAIFVEGLKGGESYFEPFTQTRYLKKQILREKLPLDGQYRILVFDREGEMGRYALSVGEIEDWGIKDLLIFPYIWLRVRLWYNPFSTMLILAVLFLVIILIFSFRKRFK